MNPDEEGCLHAEPRESHTEAAELRAELEASRAEARALGENLKSVQQLCTQQLAELRTWRLRHIALPGWTCASCHEFNGEAKEERLTCRVCDAPAPEGELSPTVTTE